MSQRKQANAVLPSLKTESVITRQWISRTEKYIFSYVQNTRNINF